MYEVGARVGAKSISCRPKVLGERLGSFLLELKAAFTMFLARFQNAHRVVVLLALSRFS